MEFSGKKLLILGGIRLASEIVKQAHKQGIYVIVTDYLENSPAKKIADKSFMVSTTDVDAVVELIQKEKIDGVITGFIDSMLPYYQAICEKAGLPCYGTKEQFEILTNKAKIKELCKQFNIPVVKDYQIKVPISQSEIAQLSYPLLVKPSDYSGARGVYICHSPDDLMLNYKKSLDFSPSKNILFEHYVTGKELHIYYLVQEGEFSLTAMSDRHMSISNSGILPLPVAYTYPSKHLKIYRDNFEAQVVEMLKSLGIQNGSLLIQAFIENETIIIYEIAYRLNGTLEYKITSKMNSVNPLEMLINFALSGSLCAHRVKPLLNPDYDDWGFSLSILAKPGKIDIIEGIEQVEAMIDVIDVVSLYIQGDEIPKSAVGTLSQVILRIYGTAKSKVSMVDLIINITNSIKVFSDNGENMLLDFFNPNALLN